MNLTEQRKLYKAMDKPGACLKCGAEPGCNIDCSSCMSETMSYASYHGKPDKIRDRSNRNKARRKLGLKTGDPREVDHKNPMSKGGGNSKSNLRAVSRHTNRTKCSNTSN